VIPGESFYSEIDDYLGLAIAWWLGYDKTWPTDACKQVPGSPGFFILNLQNVLDIFHKAGIFIVNQCPLS
jgi:hypothetical protein